MDFVVVGAGSAGGILAKELPTAGFDVVVLEQGPYRRPQAFDDDELSVVIQQGLLGSLNDVHGQTFRHYEHEAARKPTVQPVRYARGVGGGSGHFTANFWRLRQSDFRERSLLGPIEDASFADWPITYEELEPYYTKVEWEIGVSGAPGPFDAPRRPGGIRWGSPRAVSTCSAPAAWEMTQPRRWWIDFIARMTSRTCSSAMAAAWSLPVAASPP